MAWPRTASPPTPRGTPASESPSSGKLRPRLPPMNSQERPPTTACKSRCASNTTIYNDPVNLSLDWARSSFDRTHRFTANFDYQLPGRLKGWTVAGIVIVQSGLPMTLTDPNAGGVYAHAAPATVTLCPGASYSSLVTAGDTGSRLTRWIDSTAICTPPAIGSDGSTAYGSAGQSIMQGPGQFNTDFSLGKTFRVGALREDGVLAFRTEFYNALNHPQFANQIGRASC